LKESQVIECQFVHTPFSCASYFCRCVNCKTVLKTGAFRIDAIADRVNRNNQAP
jgi:hypothetical protein